MIPQAVHREAAARRAAPGPEGHRLAARRTTVLDPIIEGYVEDDLSVAELDRARPRRRARAPRRAHGRPQRVQAAPGAARRARLAEGVRQGPAAADHQPLARLTAALACRPRAIRGGTRAAAPARARARSRRRSSYGVDVRDRAGRARRTSRRSGFILLRFAVGALVLAPFALRRGWRRPGRSTRLGRATSCSAARRVRRRRASSATWFQNVGPAAHDDVELRVHHRPVRRVHAARRDGRVPPRARRATCSSRSASSVVGLFLLDRRRRSRLELGDARHARLRVHVRRAGSSSAARCSHRFDTVRAHRGPARGRRACSRSRSSLVDGFGDDRHGRSSSPCSSPASAAAARSRSRLQLWGQRYVEPSRAAVILPVRAGRRRDRRLRGRRAARRGRLRRRARDPRRHRRRRVARRGAVLHRPGSAGRAA